MSSYICIVTHNFISMLYFVKEIKKLKIQQEKATEELTVNLDDVTITVPLEALAVARNGKLVDEFDNNLKFACDLPADPDSVTIKL